MPPAGPALCGGQGNWKCPAWCKVEVPMDRNRFLSMQKQQAALVLIFFPGIESKANLTPAPYPSPVALLAGHSGRSAAGTAAAQCGPSGHRPSPSWHPQEGHGPVPDVTATCLSPPPVGSPGSSVSDVFLVPRAACWRLPRPQGTTGWQQAKGSGSVPGREAAASHTLGTWEVVNVQQAQGRVMLS